MDVNYKEKSILWILIKLKIQEMFRGNAGRKKKGTKSEKAGRALGGITLIILYIISYGMIAVSLGFLFFLIGSTLAKGELTWMYYAYMTILMFLLCFIGTVFLTETQMFEAKDNERLMAMPITPWNILVSRMVSLLLSNFAMASIVALPAGIVSIIVYGFDLVRTIFFLVAIIVVPLLALSLSMLVGWIISLLTKKVKSTKFIKLAIAIAASLIYFYFVLGDSGWVNSLIENGARYADGIKTYLPPVYSVGQAIAEKSLLHFLLMLIWCVLPFGVISYFVSRNFLKMISSGENQSSIKYKSKGIHVRSPKMSMARMEMERFLSSITYIMNGGMGLILMAIMAIFSVTSKSNIGELFMGLAMMGIAPGAMVGAIMCLGILGVMGLVCISSATISLDANTLWIPKSLPTKGSDILLSKAVPHIVISFPFVLITSILLTVKIDMDIIDRLLLIAIPLTANVFNALMGVRINARFPKFNWTNEAQAVKQGISSLLVMILGVIPVVLFMLGFIFLVLQSRISVRGLLILMEVTYLILTLWMYMWAKKKGDRVIEGLQK